MTYAARETEKLNLVQHSCMLRANDRGVSLSVPVKFIHPTHSLSHFHAITSTNSCDRSCVTKVRKCMERVSLHAFCGVNMLMLINIPPEQRR